jgi:hypothetical protein
LTAGAFADSKRHHPIPGGSRGAAAVPVAAFDSSAAPAASRFGQPITRGCLAVDFFVPRWLAPRITSDPAKTVLAFARK